LSLLRERVRAHGMEATFRLHGWCDRATMQALTKRAHLGVIPTRAEFDEGFNQACIELMASGRPVLTSGAIPAASYVSEAVQLVEADNPEAYALAIAALAADPARLTELARACKGAVAMFLDPRTAFDSAMAHVLRALHAAQPVEDRLIDFGGKVSCRSAQVRARAKPGYGDHASPVSQSTWRKESLPAQISSTPNTIGKAKRRGPIEPGLNTVKPRSRPMNGTCE